MEKRTFLLLPKFVSFLLELGRRQDELRCGHLCGPVSRLSRSGSRHQLLLLLRGLLRRQRSRVGRGGLLLLLRRLRPVRQRLVGHVDLVLPLLVHGEGVAGLADLAADVAHVARGLHVVGLDVPEHRGAPGALLAAEVAGVDAVGVGEQAHHQLVQVGHWNGRRREGWLGWAHCYGTLIFDSMKC